MTLLTAEDMARAVSVPPGMVPVSKAEFWAKLMAEKRSVHPHPEKYETHWMLGESRVRWGWSSRGYAGPFDYDGAQPEVFALAGEAPR